MGLRLGPFRVPHGPPVRRLEQQEPPRRDHLPEPRRARPQEQHLVRRLPCPHREPSPRPVKSGRLASAAQSAAVGAARTTACAAADGPKLNEAATIPRKILRLLSI